MAWNKYFQRLGVAGTGKVGLEIRKTRQYKENADLGPIDVEVFLKICTLTPVAPNYNRRIWLM